MRITFYVILTLFALSNCTNNGEPTNNAKEECNNRYNFINIEGDIPIFSLDTKKHSDTLRSEICDLFGRNLFDNCERVELKIPFEIENKAGFLKVIVDYGSCDACPIFIRERRYFQILTNRNNDLFAEIGSATKDSLKVQITDYLSKIGHDYSVPESFSKSIYYLMWELESSKDSIFELITLIFETHLNFIESELSKSGKDFCSLSKKEILELKEKYPFQIEFDLGTVANVIPPSIKSNKIIIVDDEDF